MAAGILPTPGTQAGPCRRACAHRDCEETRAAAGQPCRFCLQPIGYGTRFYRSNFDTLAHAVCLETAAERNDARVGLFP